MKIGLRILLGYFLIVTVYLAFREAFPNRLSIIDGSHLALARETFDADAALRKDDPSEIVETDDVVAMTQPYSDRFIVRVLVLVVVSVPVLVGDGVVRVLMLVALGQVQPHPDRHQGRSN